MMIFGNEDSIGNSVCLDVSHTGPELGLIHTMENTQR